MGQLFMEWHTIHLDYRYIHCIMIAGDAVWQVWGSLRPAPITLLACVESKKISINHQKRKMALKMCMAKQVLSTVYLRVLSTFSLLFSSGRGNVVSFDCCTSVCGCLFTCTIVIISVLIPTCYHRPTFVVSVCSLSCDECFSLLYLRGVVFCCTLCIVSWVLWLVEFH